VEIRYFGPRKKLFKIHFRNVSAPLPHFTETMIDDGYYDMSKIMKALVEVKFEGIVIPTTCPGWAVTRRPKAQAAQARPEVRREFRPNPALAYLLGCMNSMLIGAQSKRT
jgi:hypothetical protein